MSDDFSALESFQGTARLFPLPNLVMFPYVIQPLHIFEPRYRHMTADALSDDRLLAIALLRPGWEEQYHAQPALHAVACLGKIIAEQQLDDGRYNLLLRGLRRIRIIHELSSGKPYRSAQVELMSEIALPSTKIEMQLRQEAARHLPLWLPTQNQAAEQFRHLLASDLPLSALCDIFCFALPIEVAFKQRLLEEVDVEQRVRELLDYLESHSPPELPATTHPHFPPDFSNN